MLCQLELLTRACAASPASDLDLFMGGMAATAGAELLDRELFGLPFFVAAGGVIAPFASVALQSNQVSHCRILSLSRRSLRPSGWIFKGKAHDGNRTHDLFLTKEVLYRLSYVGISPLVS